jgi:superfamily I DNA and/or RNA helicase
MMSPLAVAQYIPNNSIHFDVCIIDEASQMPPEDAIGALFRSHQTMVVGDTKQLPPSNFFNKVYADDGSDDDQSDAVTEESVLEMANSAFRPRRMLRWHYRSRHSKLIGFSNRVMYDDDLVVFPSANEDDPSMGVYLVQTFGIYKAGLNPVEADAVVEAALSFMRSDKHRSLGIVAINKAQADYINERLQYAIARDISSRWMRSLKEKARMGVST